MFFLKFGAFLCFLNVVWGRGNVPVLIWDASITPEDNGHFPALQHMQTDQFSDYITKKVSTEKPLVVLFMEENLSVEDFRWKNRNSEGNDAYLKNITNNAKSIEFLPAVRSPYEGLRILSNHGYTWKFYDSDISKSLSEEPNVLIVNLGDPEVVKDRSDLLRDHQTKIMEIYSKLLNVKSEVLAFYTAYFPSIISEETVRREKRAEDGTNAIKYKTANFLMYTRTPITVQSGADIYPVNDPNAFTETMGTDDSMKLSFTVATILVEITFIGNPTTKGWLNTSVSYTIGSVSKELPQITDTPMWAPIHQGRSCLSGSEVYSDGIVTVTFPNYQMQPFWTEEKFGDSVDCVTFFTIGIWMCIFVMFLFFLIMTYGISMMLDINTMDRFDDPKGKTITISAED